MVFMYSKGKVCVEIVGVISIVEQDSVCIEWQKLECYAYNLLEEYCVGYKSEKKYSFKLEKGELVNMVLIRGVNMGGTMEGAYKMEYKIIIG